jgi:hypothetical protein
VNGSDDDTFIRNWTGGISRCGDEMMRMMLYEAAQALVGRWMR